ncbi:NAD(P)H-hydrate dehydratase [Candidatus Woesebacteria bacterium]|nr:NAD(P)H-hydrate dehydratase [Candidatus Woesebacteria bacterium]
MLEEFDPSELKKLYKPPNDSNGEDNGQITIVGGSSLFHGAPILALKVASRMVDMVFFATPEKSVGLVAESLKSKLSSFIWIPWEDTEKYIEKSDAVLIGPGLMRYGAEQTPHGMDKHVCDEVCEVTRNITKDLLLGFPDKKWVIDAGSLQTMEESWIPDGAILTPNEKEFELLFKFKVQKSNLKVTDQCLMLIQEKAREFKCTIVLKGPTTLVCAPDRCIEVNGGNPGLTKGGTGDVQAGLTVALLAKNDPLLAAVSAAYLIKETAYDLYKIKATYYNSDDLADEISIVLKKYI